MTKSYAELVAEIEADRSLKAALADSERNKLVLTMLSAGVAKVDIEFYGSGDSGNIDDPTVEMRPGYEKPEGLDEAIEEWAQILLESTNVDWYNNDGGQGNFHFDLTITPPFFSGEVSVNETVSTVEISWEEGAIEEDE